MSVVDEGRVRSSIQIQKNINFAGKWDNFLGKGGSAVANLEIGDGEGGSSFLLKNIPSGGAKPVSYTHLTLPTIYSV